MQMNDASPCTLSSYSPWKNIDEHSYDILGFTSDEATNNTNTAKYLDYWLT